MNDSAAAPPAPPSPPSPSAPSATPATPRGLGERLAAEGVRWSVRVDVLAPEPRTVLAREPSATMHTASIGKILLLVAVAEAIEAGRLDPAARVGVEPADAVADSGLLQFLHPDGWPVADLAALVGAFSDNLATNVLLRLVGLDRVAALAEAAGVTGVALLDRVRDGRGSQHPEALSIACADGLVGLVAALHAGRLVSPQVSARVVDWLRLDADTSMTADAFGLDPLCHRDADRGLRAWHKTGTQTGVRADTGVLEGPAATLAYAVIARWDASVDDDARRDDVLATMRDVGRLVRAAASGA